MQEIACSALRPPKTPATRSLPRFALIAPTLAERPHRRSWRSGGGIPVRDGGSLPELHDRRGRWFPSYRVERGGEGGDQVGGVLDPPRETHETRRHGGAPPPVA